MSPELRAAQAADALDAAGLHHQALGGLTRFAGSGTIAGPAFTMACAPAGEPRGERYAGLLAALDAVGRGEVVVVASGPSERAAVWGELLATACLARGAAGTVTDGPIRDSVQIAALGYPVFAAGTLPLDIDGRLEVVAHQVNVTLGGIPVAPGDTIVADDDGVVVVPRAVAVDVLDRAAAKARDEGAFREAVAEGGSATEAFRRFGVL